MRRCAPRRLTAGVRIKKDCEHEEVINLSILLQGDVQLLNNF